MVAPCRVLRVRNLPARAGAEVLRPLFGQYGELVCIHIGTAPETAGTAFVVYRRTEDAVRAAENLDGYAMEERCLAVRYWRPQELRESMDEKRRSAAGRLRKTLGL